MQPSDFPGNQVLTPDYVINLKNHNILHFIFENINLKKTQKISKLD